MGGLNGRCRSFSWHLTPHNSVQVSYVGVQYSKNTNKTNETNKTIPCFLALHSTLFGGAQFTAYLSWARRRTVHRSPIECAGNIRNIEFGVKFKASGRAGSRLKNRKTVRSQIFVWGLFNYQVKHLIQKTTGLKWNLLNYPWASGRY